jgi:UDP-N-acetylglucosamine 2-epimerase (non-hydrolysing)
MAVNVNTRVVTRSGPRPRVVVHIVGARPNFVKMAPVIAALEAYPHVRQRVVHTGQHYDPRLSADILADLELPPPDVFLGVGSGPHGMQTARTLEGVEDVLLREPPALVCVAGDVNSTLAGALAAAKLGISIAHVEAGLRSFDWTMPEEINRVLTDRLSQLLFTHSAECLDNLEAEGIPAARVHFAGNTLVDSLRRVQPAAESRRPWLAAGVARGAYVLVTLHRPSNVDDPAQLGRICAALAELARTTPVVFPMHPRTRAQLDGRGLFDALVAGGVRCLAPAGYLDFVGLEIGAGAVLTDSGGVQEETSALGVPCYTLRPNTERPVTLRAGTNRLIGEDPAAIAGIRIRGFAPRRPPIERWDGDAGSRVASVLAGVLAPATAEAMT